MDWKKKQLTRRRDSLAQRAAEVRKELINTMSKDLTLSEIKGYKMQLEKLAKEIQKVENSLEAYNER